MPLKCTSESKFFNNNFIINIIIIIIIYTNININCCAHRILLLQSNFLLLKSAICNVIKSFDQSHDRSNLIGTISDHY